MKKAIFTVFWMIAFFMVGLIIVMTAFYLMIRLSGHPLSMNSLTVAKVRRILPVAELRILLLVDWTCFFGLPVLAFLLGAFGKLPGTSTKKNVVCL